MGEQLEDALAEAEAELAAAAKTVAALTAELRKGRAKATTGELRDLRKALQNVAELGAAVHDRTAAVARMWQFDDEEHLASGAWRAEVLRHAEGAGVQVFEQEDRLVSYPVLVTVQPVTNAEASRSRMARITASPVCSAAITACAAPAASGPPDTSRTRWPLHSAAFAAADRKRTKKWSFVGTRRKRIGESAPVRPMGMGVLSGGAAQPSTNRIVRRIRRSATWPPPDGHLAVTSPPPRCRVDGGSERAGMR